MLRNGFFSLHSFSHLLIRIILLARQARHKVSPLIFYIPVIRNRFCNSLQFLGIAIFCELDVKRLVLPIVKNVGDLKPNELVLGVCVGFFPALFKLF